MRFFLGGWSLIFFILNCFVKWSFLDKFDWKNEKVPREKEIEDMCWLNLQKKKKKEDMCWLHVDFIYLFIFKFKTRGSSQGNLGGIRIIFYLSC